MWVCVLSGASMPICSVNLLVIVLGSDHHFKQPVNAQAVSGFLLQYDNRLFFLRLSL